MFHQGSYQDYLRSYHWIHVRLDMLNMTGWRCAKCGKEGGAEVHHRRYQDEKGSILGREQPDDLIVLCRGCHEDYHVIERAWLLGLKPSHPSRARRRNLVRARDLERKAS